MDAMNHASVSVADARRILDVGEETGQPRVSSGTEEPHLLFEVGGSIARVPGGP